MRAWIPVAVLCMLGTPALAHAQSTEAAATALFDEGRKLMTQHRYPEACPKLAESQRLAPSGGTLLNLAECYEKSGQTASAWVSWKDAAARAEAVGKVDVERKALARAAVLEPALARLTIAVAPDSDLPGLELRRDGVVVGHAEYGLPIPVDPGAHAIEASAPKKKPWSAKVDVAPKQTDVSVTVTLVDDVPVAVPPAAVGAPVTSPVQASATESDRAPSNAGATQRTVALVVLGAGVVGLGVGSAFGVVAMSKNNEALQPQNCRTSKDCTPAGLALTDDAKQAATISTVAFVAGAAVAATGVVLWLTSPKARGSAYVAPTMGRSFGGVTVVGAW
jgi:hypothetical protein